MEPAQIQPLVVQRVPLESLHGDPANARLHPEENLQAIVDSLRRFGQAEPLVVQAGTRRIVAGNGRYAAMKRLGFTECDVVEVSVDDLTATALGIALNRTAELAEWDNAALAKLLTELRTEDALDGVGFTGGEIDELLAELAGDQAEVDDPGPEAPPEIPVSRAGDLWVLGSHRLLCGDSTRLEDVQRVMDGEEAALLATDPPYCVDYTGADRPQDSGKDWSDKYREVEIKDLGEFLRAVLKAVLPCTRKNVAIYVWHAHLQYPVVDTVFQEFGILRHQPIIWRKPSSTFTYAYYRWAHEPCLFGWRQGHKPPHYLENGMTSVWEVDWEGKQRVVGNEHPCLHPDALVLTEAGYRPIRSIGSGDRVYSADGRFHPVAGVSSHAYTSEHLIEVVAKGSNLPTMVTDNHPFLIWKPIRAERKILGGQVCWLRADELRIGDYTMTPVMDPRCDDPYPDRDEEYWFLFGLYLAQGSLQKAGHGTNRYPTFSLHKKRQDLISRVVNKWGSVREYDQSDYGQPTQGVTVMAFDPEAGADFEHLGGRLAHAKRIAPAVLDLPRDKRMAVLQGWLNGDGCRVHNRSYWQGKTVSPDLAAHLALLGESVGYRVSVFRYDPPEVLGIIEGRRILSQRPEHHLYFYSREADKKCNRKAYIEHEGCTYSLRYVKSIKHVPYDGDVWNLSVDGCPSFQTPVGMTHNTQKPLRLFEIPMEQHTRRGEVVLEPFSGSGSQLIAAEKLGRRCRAIEISPAFVDVAVHRWALATGKKAKLEETGQSFEEVAQAR